MSLDERQFRDALGAFATGVAVVTGRNHAGERLGITVSSFNSVSITPPLVLFSIARQAHSYPTWAALRSYAVNVLSQQQEEISNRFARPRGDKWDGLTVLDGATGLPILANALAVFECEAYARYRQGAALPHPRPQAGGAARVLRRALPAAGRRLSRSAAEGCEHF